MRSIGVSDLIRKTENMRECAALLEEVLKSCVGELRETGNLIHLQKGAFVPPSQACWLEKGKCVLSLDDSRGDTLSLFYFRPGQLVNFLPLLVECFPIAPELIRKKIPSHFFHVKALVDCQLYAIDKVWFIKKIAVDPGISCLFLYSAMLNLIHSYIHVWNAPILSNTQRICRLIMAHMDDNSREIPQYLTQAEISRHLSMHSITVAKIFGKLRKIGLIRKKDNRLFVDNPALLHALADGVEKITY